MSDKKVAFPTEDGQTISRHFGRAPLFKIVAIQNGIQTAAELRGNPNEQSHHEHQHHEHQHQGGHNQGHGAKFALVADCQVLIGAGMGQPAYDRLQNMGLEVFLTGEKQIDAALAHYLNGTLTSDMRRIHAHHHHDHNHEHETGSNVTFVDNTSDL